MSVYSNIDLPLLRQIFLQLHSDSSVIKKKLTVKSGSEMKTQCFLSLFYETACGAAAVVVTAVSIENHFRLLLSGFHLDSILESPV